MGCAWGGAGLHCREGLCPQQPLDCLPPSTGSSTGQRHQHGPGPTLAGALPLPGGAAGVCDAPRQSCACTVLLWVRVGCRGRAAPCPRQPQRPTWDKLCWFQTRCPGSLAVAPPVPWAPDALPFCPQTAGRAPPGPLRAPSLCNRQRWGGQRGRGAAGQAGSAGCACVRAGREGAKGPLVLSRCCSPE